MSGVIEKTYTCGRFERIELKLNYYGLAQALIKAGLIPEGFSIEHACFDEDGRSIFQATLHKETLGDSGRP